MISMSREDFRKAIHYYVNQKINYDTDEVTTVLYEQKVIELAELIKETPNKKLLAYRDPLVKRLVNYIMTASITESEQADSFDPSFPLKIYRRYKSKESLSGKMAKKGLATDYLGFRIVPSVENEIYFANGDPVLEEMIERRDNIRKAIVSMYKTLSSNKTFTFEKYCNLCKKALDNLKAVFTDKSLSEEKQEEFAKDRIASFDEAKHTLADDLRIYKSMFDNPNKEMSLDEILENCTSINIKDLLHDLSRNLNNEVTLYKLKSDLMNLFQNNEVLSTLGISVSYDKNRTKSKAKSNRL